ncbi:hypothetical protein F5Y19DRAFT_223504 [Xylariaceae sp. FL1651]|nr:hypothetical protein F5Y19DRAFT_223504 [Xylariaceae sp. FL1651]
MRYTPNSWNLGAAIIVIIGGRLSYIAARRYFLFFGAASATICANIGAISKTIDQTILSGIIFGVGSGFKEMCFACGKRVCSQKNWFKTVGEWKLSIGFHNAS